MPEKRNFERELYGTKQVAELLNIPEWRVKNFAEGKAYGLRPTQKIGSGHGSRRLYDVLGLRRLAIASDLVDAGFTPEAVGRALRVVRDDDLGSFEEFLGTRAAKLEKLPLLVCEKGEWAVQNAKEVEETFEARFKFVSGWDHGGVFVLNFLNRIVFLEQRIENSANNHPQS
jgi:hypothetical protein